jgi:mono/diheme cytochrome c family protein
MRRLLSVTAPILLIAGCAPEPTRPVSSDGVRHERLARAPEGSVPRGAAAARQAAAASPPVTLALLADGRRGYADFCAPCHGSTGRGDGPVIARGFTQPQPLGIVDRSPERVVRIIAQGHGAMLPMAEQVPPAERWAIAHFLAEAGGP